MKKKSNQQKFEYNQNINKVMKTSNIKEPIQMISFQNQDKPVKMYSIDRKYNQGQREEKDVERNSFMSY